MAWVPTLKDFDHDLLRRKWFAYQEKAYAAQAHLEPRPIEPYPGEVPVAQALVDRYHGLKSHRNILAQMAQDTTELDRLIRAHELRLRVKGIPIPEHPPQACFPDGYVYEPIERVAEKAVVLEEQAMKERPKKTRKRKAITPKKVKIQKT